MSFFSHCDVKNLTEPCHNDIIRLVDVLSNPPLLFKPPLGLVALEPCDWWKALVMMQVWSWHKYGLGGLWYALESNTI